MREKEVGRRKENREEEIKDKRKGKVGRKICVLKYTGPVSFIFCIPKAWQRLPY